MTIMRWPVEEMGRNSVTPSTTPRMIASRTLSRGRCFLYVLPLASHEDVLKLGCSRDPLDRVQALHPRYFEVFDLERAFLVETEAVRDARALELELRRMLVAHNAPAPLTVRREAAGHTEWYRGAFAQLAGAVAQDARSDFRNVVRAVLSAHAVEPDRQFVPARTHLF